MLNVLAERRAALTRAIGVLSQEEQLRLARLVGKMLAGLATDGERAGRICRLCDYLACPHDTCPVALGLGAGRRPRRRLSA